MTTQPRQIVLGRDKRLFVTDLDGTLLNDYRRIAPIDLAALTDLRQAGVAVALATGRSNHSLAVLFKNLGYGETGVGLPVDHVIFATGAGIMDCPSGRIRKSAALSVQEVRHISTVLSHRRLDHMIHRPVPDTVYFLHSPPSGNNPDFHRRLQLYREFAVPLSPDTLARCGGATEVLCIVDAQNGHQIAAELVRDLRQFSVIKATSPLDGTSIWIEIFAPAVSKSQAVSWLAAEIGVAQKEVCAVGNDYNDLDLLHWAGKGFVVANSPAAIKAHFPEVASNNCGGVAEAIARWYV